MGTKAEQDAVFQRLMDLGRGFQPDLYDVAGEVVKMLEEAAASSVRETPEIPDNLANRQAFAAGARWADAQRASLGTADAGER